MQCFNFVGRGDGCDIITCTLCVQVESSQLLTGSVKKCECHVKVEDKTARRAKIKLVVASVIALLFMIGEVLGKRERCPPSPRNFIYGWGCGGHGKVSQ